MIKNLCVIFILLFVVLVTGCRRRALEDESGDLARVPIHIDWSQSQLDVTTVHSVSVWFFPHDGTPSFEYRFEDNLTDMEVMLPSGSYSIIVFNENIDANWESLEFMGSDKYETFRVEARASTFRGLNTRVEASSIRKSPDALAKWSMDRFEVSSETIYATTMAGRAEDVDPNHRINVTMMPMTKAVKITAYVQNLTSALRCSGTLSGVAGSISLSTGAVYGGDAAHVFIMNDRQFKEGSNNGYIHANLFIFRASNAGQNILQIDFELTDGKFASPLPFNVTDQISPTQPQVEVNVGSVAEDDEKDHPIILPEVDVNGEVSVDDWHNQIIPIT